MSKVKLKPQSRKYMYLSLVGIVLFLINLGLGKLALLYHWELWLHLDGVAEFLLLLITIISFVVGTLLNEQRGTDKDLNQPEEEHNQ